MADIEGHESDGISYGRTISRLRRNTPMTGFRSPIWEARLKHLLYNMCAEQ